MSLWMVNKVFGNSMMKFHFLNTLQISIFYSFRYSANQPESIKQVDLPTIQKFILDEECNPLIGIKKRVQSFQMIGLFLSSMKTIL